MSEAFLKAVNMSISAGWLVLAVLTLRLILKKAPNWVNVLLWGIVAVRLICPFSIESALSLIPSPETISPEIMMDPMPEITTGIPALNSAINPIFSDSFAPNPGDSANPLQFLIPVAANIWVFGIFVLLLYTAVSYASLRRKLRMATILRDNIYQCETVDSPFVLGIVKPRIYLPYGMEDPHVIAHEQAHIRRFDHWWKPLGFLLLSIHWFNPLMWVAYILLCRDIELACDEKVIRELGNEQRADYTQALVACSVNRRMIAACPLAFGEVGVKERVRSIMNYRKPTFWIIVTALGVCCVVAVCFLTDPKPAPELAMKGSNVSDLDPEGIVERIMDYQDIENSNVYMNASNFSLTVDGNFDWVDSQAIRYFYYENHKVRSAQLRIFPDENKYFLTESDEWPDQNRIFLLRHYLDALKYLPQEAIRELAPADRYLIEQIDEGSPSGYDRVITYSPNGVGETDGWYLHLRLLPLHDDGEGYGGTGEEVIHLFYGDSAGDGAEVWFDFSDQPELMDWNSDREYTMDQFPGVTFRCNPYEIAVGETVLIQGMPIWSAYLEDLNGDGYPEICAETSFGSGMIDQRIIIYDYANRVSYLLEDRGYHDFYLWRNGDGFLYVDKRVYNSDELVSSGRLIIKNGCIELEGSADTPIENNLEFDTLVISHESKNGEKSAATITDDAIISQILSMYRSLVIEEYSRPLAEERMVLSFFNENECKEKWYVSYYEEDNEIVTCGDAFGLGNRRVLNDLDYDWLFGFFQEAGVKMIPTNTDLLGCPAGALLVPIDGDVYRYALTEADPEGVTAHELLYTFTEANGTGRIEWEVYSLKEYPDKTAVLMLSGTNGAWLCRYSPPTRCSEYALNQVMAAGYVVMEDGIGTSGQQIWQEFYDRVQQGKAASVAVAHYHTLDPERCSSEYYETYSQDYPCLFEYRLDYDGKAFTLTEPDGEGVRIRTYSYLMKYDNAEFYAQSYKTPGGRYEYVLTHDNQVTWEQLWNGLVSSQAGAYIDHYTIFRTQTVS